MWRLVAVAVLILVVISVSACGSHVKVPPKPVTTAVAAPLIRRLRAGGYTVSTLARQRRQPYEQAVYITAVDWTTTHSFDVSVYVFSSAERAKLYRETLIDQGRFPSTNRWRQVGTLLFVGSSTETGGGQQCTIVDNKPKCPALPKVPAADFAKLVSVAAKRGSA